MIKKAIVFGHSSGLGKAITELLLKEDYEILGIARTNLEHDSKNLTNLVADLADSKEVERIAETIKKRFAQFAVLIYSAGILSAHDIDYLDPKTLQQVFRVDLFAPMIIESRLHKLIRSNGADVVNITSSAIDDYYPKYAEYTPAKTAFAKFTDDLRRSLEKTPARVIEIRPAGFASNIYVQMIGDKVDRDESQMIRAEDLARFILDILKLPKRIEVGRIFINRKP
ncbi:MAG: SDR family oxidoreductase [Candidatus Woykebacteria bacterium]